MKASATAPYGILTLSILGLLPVALIVSAFGAQVFWISLTVELNGCSMGRVNRRIRLTARLSAVCRSAADAESTASSRRPAEQPNASSAPLR